MRAIIEMFLGALLVTIQTAVAIAGATVGMYLGVLIPFMCPVPVTEWMNEHRLYLRNDLTIPWDFAFGIFGAAAGAAIALRLLRRPLSRLSSRRGSNPHHAT